MKHTFIALCLMLIGVSTQAQLQLDPWNQLPASLRQSQSIPEPSTITEFQSVLPNGKLAIYRKHENTFQVQGSRSGKSYYTSSVFVEDSSLSTVQFTAKGMEAVFTDVQFEYKSLDGQVSKIPVFNQPPPTTEDIIPIPKKFRKKQSNLREAVAPIPNDIKYGTSVINKTLTLYGEVCFDVFTRLRTKEEVSRQFGVIYTMSQLVYRNEGIKVRCDQLFIWETIDPYAQYTSAFEVLSLFANIRKQPGKTINQHVGTLFNDKNWGGLGFLNALGNLAFNFVGMGGFSAPQGTTMPSYNWVLACLVHEIGHNIASNHTHWCGWQNEFGQYIGRLDSCFPGESPGAYPFNCGQEKKWKLNGSWMGYCHANGTINLYTGATKYPRGVMREALIRSTAIPEDGGQAPACTSWNLTWGPCVNGIETLISAVGVPAGCTGNYTGPTTRACSPARDTSTIQFYFDPITARYRAKLYFSKAVGTINVCRYSSGSVDSLPIPTVLPAVSNCGRRNSNLVPTASNISNGWVDFELSPQPGNWNVPCNPCGSLWYVVKRTTSRGDIYSNKLYIRKR